MMARAIRFSRSPYRRRAPRTVRLVPGASPAAFLGSAGVRLASPSVSLRRRRTFTFVSPRYFGRRRAAAARARLASNAVRLAYRTLALASPALRLAARAVRLSSPAARLASASIRLSSSAVRLSQAAEAKDHETVAAIAGKLTSTAVHLNSSAIQLRRRISQLASGAARLQGPARALRYAAARPIVPQSPVRVWANLGSAAVALASRSMLLGQLGRARPAASNRTEQVLAQGVDQTLADFQSQLDRFKEAYEKQAQPSSVKKSSK